MLFQAHESLKMMTVTGSDNSKKNGCSRDGEDDHEDNDDSCRILRKGDSL